MACARRAGGCVDIERRPVRARRLTLALAAVLVFGGTLDTTVESIDGPAVASRQAERGTPATLSPTTIPANVTVLDVTPLIAATNGYRALYGLPALTASLPLSLAAEAHTIDMATNLYIAHTGTDGSTPLQRAQAAGYPGSYVGENLAAGFPDVTLVLAAWIASPHHQANLADPLFDQIGVAAALGSDGRLYWTMDLGSSKS